MQFDDYVEFEENTDFYGNRLNNDDFLDDSYDPDNPEYYFDD